MKPSSGIRSVPWVVPVALTLLPAPTAVAQGSARLDEMVALEGAIKGAIDKVAPSIVTIETFGGTRKPIGRTPTPGDKMPGAPDDKPKLPDGFKLPVDPEELESKRDDKNKKLGPIVMPGFIQAQGATTGIIVTTDGWILTSRFNLNFDPSTIIVTLSDGDKFTARLAGQDTGRGLALLKIEPKKELPVPKVAAPSEVKVGEWVLNLGRSFGGQNPSVHVGIVSALDRLGGRAIQMDAYASPANYGGPLVDTQGRVLGCITPMSPDGRDASVDWYDSGIGFAATWVDVPDYLENLKKGAIFETGYLGIVCDIGWFGPGARIEQVAPKSPAEGLDIKVGDVVMEFDGQAVRHNFHLQDLIARKAVGDFVGLKIRRPPGPAKVPKKSKPEKGKPPKYDPAAEAPTEVPEGGETIEMTVLLAPRPKQDREAKTPENLPSPEEKRKEKDEEKKKEGEEGK